MISIQKNLSELERFHKARDLVLDCYVSAIRNTSHYAIELDPQMIQVYRQHLDALAAEVATGDAELMADSRATVRGLLRDYRDKAADYLARLRDELAGTARALQEIMESMTQTEGDHETQLRAALVKLRAICRSADGSLRDSLAAATNSIEQSMEQLRKQNQLTIAQFLTEIRVLHQRIDALESAAAIDDMTKLFTHGEMEDRIRSLSAGAYYLLLVRAGGLRTAAVTFNRDVASELAAAFTKRLKNSLPENIVVGRWAEEDFVAILHGPKAETISHGKFIAEHLGGPYACLLNGKTVRPSLKLRIGVVDSNGDKPEKVLERVSAFLP